MKEHASIEWAEGGIYVVHTWYHQYRPVLVADHYRVIARGEGDVPGPGEIVTREGGGSTWWYGATSLVCERYPSRGAEWPLHPPKARGRTRWHLGRWQVHGKGGWRDAR